MVVFLTASVCPNGEQAPNDDYLYVNGMVLKLTDEKLTFFQSWATCSAEGAYLLSSDSIIARDSTRLLHSKRHKIK